MTARIVRFHYGFFYHAMIALIGREPDSCYRQGWDGIYAFRYEPKGDDEKKKLAESVLILRDWLSMFELIPLHSRCEYGRLVDPRKDEEGKDYLDIYIMHPVEKKEKDK